VAGMLAFIVLVSLPPIIHHAAAASRYKEHGLLGKYYQNATCSGTPVEVSVDSEINFDWSKSLPLTPPFSIEWTGSIAIEVPDNYVFSLVADDGALLEIDGNTVVDVTKGPVLQKKMGSIRLEPGLHKLRILYYNPLFGGLVKLSWIGRSRVEEIVPNEVLIPPPQSAASPK
jgi:PA14 domain